MAIQIDGPCIVFKYEFDQLKFVCASIEKHEPINTTTRSRLVCINMEESAIRIIFHLINKKLKYSHFSYCLENSTAHGTSIRSRFRGKELSMRQKNRSRVNCGGKVNKTQQCRMIADRLSLMTKSIGKLLARNE